MYTKELLINKLNEMDIDCYEMASDINEHLSIQLESLEQFFLFIMRHNIDTVFYRFGYASADDLQITEDVLDDFYMNDEFYADIEVIEAMQSDFDKYNFTVSNLDFSRPYILSVCCLYQGHMIYSVESDYWFRELGYEHPKVKALSMIEEKLEEIENEEVD